MARRRRRRTHKRKVTRKNQLTPAKKKAVRKHVTALKRLLKIK
jgi:hypothetical protein